MGFLKNNAAGGSNIFLEVDTEQNKKRIRPLMSEPTMFWGHKIQSPEVAVTLSTGEAKTLRLRSFHWEVCTSTNKKGIGCFLHHATDPGWQFLAPRDQTNKKGQRTDFPMGRKILLPVWSYADNAVKVLDGGNQIYEEMDKYFDLGKNIEDCDWVVWKTGEKKNTTYKSAREDATAFAIQVSEEQIKEALKEAIGERYTATAAGELQNKILCLSPDQAKAEFEAGQSTKPGMPALQAGPTRPALPPAVAELTPAEQALKSAMPHLSIDQIRAMLSSVVPGGTPGNFSVAPSAQPVAPISQPTPVVQEPVVTTPTEPGDYVLSQGKYQGKMLSFVVATDHKYAVYLRAQGYDETVRKLAGQVLDSKPAMPEAVEPEPVVPAPVVAPVTTPTGDVVATQQPAAAGGDAGDSDRKAMAAECNALIKAIPDFKGLGMSKHLIPLLKQINPKKFDYNQWSVGELQSLKARLLQKTGHDPINPTLA